VTLCSFQHPYVRTLTINAFNPGRASFLADALTALQREEAFQNLRYEGLVSQDCLRFGR
jgi:hypothetical protein